MMNTWLDNLAYCGTAPIPAELWLRWNLDPWLLSVLALLMLGHARYIGILRRESSPDACRHTGRRLGCFVGGWSAMVLGLISPLCALSVALFSARVLQHMWLILIAVPLLVWANAHPPPRGGAQRVSNFLYPPMMVAGAFAVCLWFWHAPRMYALTFTSDVMYWLMHLTLIGSALLLWRAITSGSAANFLTRIGAGFLTLLQMGLLGALLTLSQRLLYVPHVMTAPLWGLSALEDQQLGGLLMWVPAGWVLIMVVLGTVFGILKTPTAATS